MVFKKLLCIIWFTSIINSIQAANYDPLSADEQQMIVDRYNVRKWFLGEFQSIANGWELSWSADLTTLAGRIASDFHPDNRFALRNGPNYRVFFTTTKTKEGTPREDQRDTGYSSGSKVNLELTNEHFTSDNDFDDSDLEAVRMLQRSIGCVHYEFRTDYTQFDCLCVVGPYGFADLSTKSHIRGAPGSHCEPYGIKLKKLCVLIPQPPTTKKPKKKKKNREDDDYYDEDSDDEDSGRRKKKKKKNRDEEEYDLVLYLDSVRQNQGTFLAVVLVLVILLVE